MDSQELKYQLQELFRDPKKKNAVLGSVAGVILLVAVILVLRGAFGGVDAPVDDQTMQATQKLVEQMKQPAPTDQTPPAFVDKESDAIQKKLEAAGGSPRKAVTIPDP